MPINGTNNKSRKEKIKIVGKYFLIIFSSAKDIKNIIVKFRKDELHHKDIAYEEGATKDGIYSIMDKIIKTGSKIAIGISEKI